MTDWSKGFFDLAMAQDPPPKTIALVGADAEFARNAVKGARANAQKLGLDIVYDESYPPRTADYTPNWTRCRIRTAPSCGPAVVSWTGIDP